MKNFTLVSMLTMLLSMVCVKAAAYDIAAENSSGVTIYYNYINEGTELEVTFPSSTSVGYSGEIVIPESVDIEGVTLKVTSIGYRAFYGRDITTVTIPNNVKSIQTSAFGYSDINSIIFGNGVTEIGSQAFQYCGGLTSITIPSNVVSIGQAAFEQCSGLKTLTIQNGVTSIGQLAFSYCTHLETVTIPNSITEIGDRAFQQIDSLKSFYSFIKEPFTIPDFVFYITSNHDVTLYVPQGTKEAYISVGGWTKIRNIVEFDDESMGIEQVQQQGTRQDGVFYTLNGHRAVHPTKGIYILNGKKIAIR